MILERKLPFEGTDDVKELNALFDSGASYSCVNIRHVENDFATFIKLRRPYQVETAQEKTYMEITHLVHLDFELDNIRMSDDFLVVRNVSEDVIIGAYTMQKWKIKLDFENDVIITNPKVARLRLM
jgi:Aspartyl protease